MPRHEPLNKNEGLWVAGIKSQQILSPADSQNFLKSLVEDFHPRCRTSDDFKRASLSYLDRWKFCCDLWDSLDLADLDFAQQQKLRTEFFFVGTTRPFRSHAERRTWSEDFINGWIRSNSKPADS